MAASVLLIDCDECILQDTDACADCVVSFLCGEEASQPVVVDNKGNGARERLRRRIVRSTERKSIWS